MAAADDAPVTIIAVVEVFILGRNLQSEIPIIDPKEASRRGCHCRLSVVRSGYAVCRTDGAGTEL